MSAASASATAAGSSSPVGGAAGVSVRLLELANLAKKALTFAQADCSKANDLVLASERQRDEAFRRYPRVAFVNGELARQISVLSTLVSKVADHHDVVFHQYELFEDELPRIYADLDSVFQLLKERAVAPELQKDAMLLLRGAPASTTTTAATKTAKAAASPVVSPSEMTLFDFVDTESVNNLKQRTASEMTAIKDLYTSSHRVCVSLQDHVDTFADALAAAGVVADLSDGALAIFENVRQEQNAISESMADALLRLGSYYERCMEALRISRERPEAVLNISAIENEAANLPVVIDHLDGRLQRLADLSEEIKQRTQQLNDALQEHSRLFKQMDDFSPRLRAGLSGIKAAEDDLFRRKVIIGNCRDEFVNLIAWYDLFYDAYDRLIIEIDRRQALHRQYIARVERLVAELRDLSADENRHRQGFADSHGQYLPPPLRASLNEPLPQLQISLDSLSIRLPVLSDATISSAKERIRQRATEDSIPNTSSYMS